MARRPVVILGIDALDLELTETWAREGHLPTFARLLHTWRWGPVENPRALEAGSVWPTFTTGIMPDHHGQFDGPYRFDTDRYEVRLLTMAERGAAPFWLAASAAGRRVAIVDIPYVLLEDGINGVQIVDWLTHVRTWPSGLAAWPADLAVRIAERYGVNPFGGPNRCPTNDLVLETPEAIATFRDQLRDRVSRKEALCRELLAQEPWDLFFVVFHDAHDIGHMCWHVHDPTHERHRPGVASAIGDPLRDVSAAIDAAIGRLLTLIGDTATVIVYSSHGMGPERTATGFLDDILIAFETAYTGRPPGTWIDRVRPLYRSTVPRAVRRRLARTRPVVSAYAHHHTGQLKQRRFFELAANHATGGVRFNLKGRERFGRVAPGSEFDALRDRLGHDLLQIINESTGEPLIESIIRTSDLYPGPMRNALPDLLLEWNKRAPIDRVTSPGIGTLACRHRRVRSGDHVHKVGTYFVRGPGIAAGYQKEAIRTVDFAPTLAALVGFGGQGYVGQPIAGVIPPRASANE
jgi:predicted AlkP superfamily phosphohydrolase/phosphomutase